MTFTQPNPYYEDIPYRQFIGWISSSFVGFFWNYLVFNEIVNINNFYSTSYSGSNCLQSPCPSSCSPAIIEAGSSYCISLETSISCVGCDYGCKDNICLNCTSCISQSCAIYGGEVLCICPSNNYMRTCDCGYGLFMNKYYKCESCYSECLYCTDNINCTICKDQNSLPYLGIGCICKIGYYNLTALKDSGICLECYPECSSCTNTFTCSACKDPNSNPHPKIGCECKPYYFNSSSLLINGFCQKCHIECLTCSDSLRCDSCIDQYAKPNKTMGCICNQLHAQYAG